MYKLLKKPFFGRFMVNWKSPLTETERQQWQSITFKSKTGATLIAWYAPSYQQAKATIVLGHPMGKEAKGYFLKHGYTQLLRTHGYNTVVFDVNGFGESTMGSFSYYDDIIAAGLQASKITPDLPIGYHGISLGGQWATIAFTDPTHPYRFAIVESAAPTLDDFWKNHPFPYKVLRILKILMPQYARHINMEERIKEAKNLNSILFIYSHADKWTPVDMGQRFLNNCPIPSELWTLETADHALIMKSEERELYKHKIIDYFDRSISNITPVVSS